MHEKMIGLNIRRLREEKGLSQQQVANKLHVTFQAVSKRVSQNHQ